MDIYTVIHDNLVNSRKHLKEEWKPVGSTLERHHIVPRHTGGLDEESNYTYLTLREHIIAHWLLWKLHGRSEDRIACLAMRGKNIKAPFHSEATRKKISEAQKGKVHSEATRKKMSEAKKGFVPWNKGKKTGYSPCLGKVHSEEVRRKISEGNKGKVHSEASRKKISEAKKGKVVSEATKKKISEANKGKTPWNKGKTCRKN
jgi:hypothetical protein